MLSFKRRVDVVTRLLKALLRVIPVSGVADRDDASWRVNLGNLYWDQLSGPGDVHPEGRVVVAGEDRLTS